MRCCVFRWAPSFDSLQFGAAVFFLAFGKSYIFVVFKHRDLIKTKKQMKKIRRDLLLYCGLYAGISAGYRCVFFVSLRLSALWW